MPIRKNVAVACSRFRISPIFRRPGGIRAIVKCNRDLIRTVAVAPYTKGFRQILKILIGNQFCLRIDGEVAGAVRWKFLEIRSISPCPSMSTSSAGGRLGFSPRLPHRQECPKYAIGIGPPHQAATKRRSECPAFVRPACDSAPLPHPETTHHGEDCAHLNN